MSAGQTNLLNSWEEPEEEDLGDGVRVTRFMASGERHTTAIADAVIDRYGAILERRPPTSAQLEEMGGLKVTLIQAGENMFGARLLNAQEGKLVTGSFGLGIIPKGARTKGYRVTPERVLDVLPGYDTEQAVELVAKVRAHFPRVGPVTTERLKELPTNSETLSLCVFGNYVMPWGNQTDALYLAAEYLPSDDVIYGIVLLRGENGVSEHGSIYGRQLVEGNFGEVLGYSPISFGEGIALCDLPFDAAYERLLGNCVAA